MRALRRWCPGRCPPQHLDRAKTGPDVANTGAGTPPSTYVLALVSDISVSIRTVSDEIFHDSMFVCLFIFSNLMFFFVCFFVDIWLFYLIEISYLSEQ